jgi:CBS-domain-containing membrane protein
LPDNLGQPGREPETETPGEFETTDTDAGLVAVRDAAGANNLHLLPSDGRVHVLPHRLSKQLHLPEHVEVVDPRFRRYWHSYVVQAVLATVTMLFILLFVDSLADAALAAGLGSSVAILFVHPSASAAKARSVIGGHSLALLFGVGCSLLIFHSSAGEFIAQNQVLSDIALAASVGMVILIMAVTNTEHPPAAATVLGMAIQPIDPLRTAVFIAAIILLALIHLLFKSRLHDLI